MKFRLILKLSENIIIIQIWFGLKMFEIELSVCIPVFNCLLSNFRFRVAIIKFHQTWILSWLSSSFIWEQSMEALHARLLMFQDNAYAAKHFQRPYVLLAWSHLLLSNFPRCLGATVSRWGYNIKKNIYWKIYIKKYLNLSGWELS